MSSAGSGMAASQSSLGGTASNSIEVDGAGEEVGGVINPKYPFWKHATKLEIEDLDDHSKLEKKRGMEAIRQPVECVQPNNSMSPAMSRLHINGRLYLDDMAPGTSDADLRRHFGRYGDVADIFIPTYRLTGQPRCCTFVQFSSPGDAGRALADPHHVINGREVYIGRAQPRHLEESSVYQYKPLCKRHIRDAPWHGYRVVDIGKTSFGPIVYDSIITYISEDGVECWCKPVTMHTESKSTGYGPRQD